MPFEISWHGGNTGRIIGCLPASVLPGATDLCQTRWLHAPFANQPFGFSRLILDQMLRLRRGVNFWSQLVALFPLL
jgi:hypothetical protein